MHYIKFILSMALAICLVFCPICTKVKANPVIGGFVIGLFLSVAISLGFYFEINNTDISAWVEAKIQAFLQANGYQSIEAWLGANFEAEASVSGTYLGLTPNLYAKIKAAVEFAIGSNNDDLPSGGTVSDPVSKTIAGGYYFPSIEYNGNTVTDFQIMDLRPLLESSQSISGYVGGAVSFHVIPDLPNGWTLPVPSTTTTQNISFTSNNQTISGYNYITYDTGANVKAFNQYNIALWGFGGQRNSIGTLQYPSSIMPVNNSAWGQFNYDSRVQPIISFGIIDNQPKAVPVYCWKAINGAYYVSYRRDASYWSWLTPYGGTNQIDAFSVGNPGYSFNNSDLIYIDLQLGQINSALQALLDLIAAINNNLISWTIALQTNSPGDLPVDTTPLIDFVDYCNEQTNLYLSGTSTLANTVGNMYQQLYSTLSGIQSAPLSDACINTYNAFINKLTLFSQYENITGSNTQVVQDFIDALEVIYNGYVRSAGSSISPTISQVMDRSATAYQTALGQASTVEEIIGLNTAYEEFMLRIDNLYTRSTYARGSAAALNTIVDNYLSGSIDRGTALTNLLTRYKSDISSAKSVYDCAAIVSAYQACLDRISLEDLSIDPDGLGDTADEVITMEDDLLSHIDLDELSVMLDFQNWTYINSSEGSLYREFFQKIMDSNSPFYLFIYVPMILGIVGIVLGTRVTLPHKVKASHDDSITVNPNLDRYHSDYNGRGA